MAETPSTAEEDYAERLVRLQTKTWKKVLHVQLPWQLHIRSMKLGRTLDVGCGIGRNLVTLGHGSVGVDHNEHAILAARKLGVEAYTVDEFFADKALTAPGGFDSLLSAHVIEHLTPAEAREVIGSYLPMIKPGGRIVWICPQEVGYRSDATHVTFADFDELADLAADLGLETVKQYSFPFPRPVGKAFIYNEFIFIARKPA